MIIRNYSQEPIDPNVLKTVRSNDFTSPTIGVACKKALEQQQSTGRDLNSKTIGIRAKINHIIDLLEPMLEYDQYPMVNPELNIDNSKIIQTLEPKSNIEIPKCIKALMTDNIDINNLSEIELENINNEVDIIINSEQTTKDEINELLDNLMPLMVKKEDIELFKELDKLMKLINNRPYNELVADYYDKSDCVYQNCESLIPDLYNDSFLWYNNLRNKLIVPVSLSDNSLIMKKLFTDICSIKLARLEIIEVRYFQYLKIKEDFLKTIDNIRIEDYITKNNSTKIIEVIREDQ